MTPVQVRVLFFGMLKDLVGQTSESLSLPEGSTLGDLLSQYESRIPRLKDFLPSIACSVNREYASPEVILRADDEIGLLPPVSGGSAKQHAAIVHEKIDSQSVTERLKQPQDGAAVIFEGVVRNHTRGRPTLYLDYETYEEMALERMESLAKQSMVQFQIRDVALVHRLGRLEIGETSVLIVVVAAHRAAAFEACRWLIDTLKRTVPIWKKEYFADGAVWADGEPFPAEIPRAEGTPSGRSASN